VLTAAVTGAAAAVLVAGAAVPLLRRRPGLRTARARARSAHARLGHLLAAADVDAARAGRAHERWTTAGALLSRARSAEDLAVAERTAAEGVTLLGGS
jgi:hypothetical protein